MPMVQTFEGGHPRFLFQVNVADDGQAAIYMIQAYGLAAVNFVREAVLKSGMTITLESKKRCPVDTGRLRASIGMWDGANLIKENAEARPEDAVWELTDNNLNLRLGTNVWYAWDVETKPAHHITGQVGFMKAGVDASMNRVVEYFKLALKKAEAGAGGSR